MQIARLGPGDEHEVLAAGAVFDHAPRPDWTTAFLADPASVLLVARDDHRVIGMLSATRLTHPDKPAELFIRELGVLASHRRRGIGSALVRAAVDLAPSIDCPEVWLLTEEDNLAAAGLYDHLGGDSAAGAVVWTWPSASGSD